MTDALAALLRLSLGTLRCWRLRAADVADVADESIVRYGHFVGSGNGLY